MIRFKLGPLVRTHRPLLRIILFALLFGLIMAWVPSAMADVIIPSALPAFIQTTGRLANIGIGDYRTNDPIDVDGGGAQDVAGAGDNLPHELLIDIPCLPNATFNFDLFDPEVFAGGATIDEVRNNNDTANFRLFNPAGTQIFPASGWQTYAPAAATNNQWVTLTPVTLPANPVEGTHCGRYRLQSYTGVTDPAAPFYNTAAFNNDDNAWRFRLVGANDGSGSPFLVENGPDGFAGTGDEVWAGLQYTSYQHSPAGCQSFYWFIPDSATNLYLLNFDLDGSQRVCYFPPGVGGTCDTAYPGPPVVQGTLSNNTRWNDAPPQQSPRPGYAAMNTFDLVSDFAGDAIANPPSGFWRAQICVGTGNQYSFEVPPYVVFLDQPQGANVQISKTDGVTTVNSPGTTTYTLTLTNTDPGAAMPIAGPEVVDTLPPGMTATACTVNAPLVGTCSGIGTGTVSVDLTAQSATVPAYLPGVSNAPANTGTITITASIAAGLTGQLTNTATVDWTDIYDNNYTPASATDVDDVVPAVDQVDLELQKGLAPPSPAFGDAITYTITLFNNSAVTATNIQVTENIPAGLSGVTVTPSTGTWSAPTWSIPALAGGATATLTINAQVTGTGSFNNTAEVTAVDQPDVDSTPNNCQTAPEDDCGTASFSIPPIADLSLSKTVDNSQPGNGDTITYTITVNNAGPDQATNVAVTDTWTPAGGLTNITTTPSQGTVSVGSGTLTWTVGTLNVSASATLTVSATYTGTDPVSNTAQVSASDQDDPDSTPNNGVPGEDDQASLTVPAAPIDLSLDKVVDNSAPAQGDNVTFTLTIYNAAGAGNATGVAVQDALPGGLSLVTATPSQGSYDSSTNIWTVGSLANGTSATLQLTVNVTGTGTITNTAEVSAAGQQDLDSTPNNGNTLEDDYASASITVRTQPPPPPPPPPDDDLLPLIGIIDPVVTKSGSPATAVVGEPVVWTIFVSNPGNAPINGVVVGDTVPAAFTITGVSTTQGSYTINGQSVSVNIGTLQPGQQVVIQINTLGGPIEQAGEVCNTASVGSVRARACVDLLPELLPLTGGRPVWMTEAVRWLMLASAALVSAALGWLYLRPKAASHG
mgnify:CR=1 FL=1